jgi:hypothetical protein
MALTERNGIWHWGKIVQGHTFARSTMTGDKKLAEQIAALWEADAIKEVVLKGTRPVLLHSVIKAFLDARKGAGGHASALVHLKHFLALPNVRMGGLTLAQLQGVLQKRRDAGDSHNTLVVTVCWRDEILKRLISGYFLRSAGTIIITHGSESRSYVLASARMLAGSLQTARHTLIWRPSA